MYLLSRIFNTIMTSVSMLTALGVFLHDGRVDKAASTVFNRSIVIYSNSDAPMIQRYRSFIDTDAHTHPDHNAARSSLLNNFAYQSPSVPPNSRDQRKHHLEDLRARGHHAFDNNTLPIIA
jgi:hypothetical protein